MTPVPANAGGMPAGTYAPGAVTKPMPLAIGCTPTGGSTVGGGQARVTHTALNPHHIDSRARYGARPLTRASSCRCSRCGSLTKALIGHCWWSEAKAADSCTRCWVSSLTQSSRRHYAQCGSLAKALIAGCQWSKAEAAHSNARVGLAHRPGAPVAAPDAVA